MTDPIHEAADTLRAHAAENQNPELAEALRKFAVANNWEDPSTADIASKIRL